MAPPRHNEGPTSPFIQRKDAEFYLWTYSPLGFQFSCRSTAWGHWVIFVLMYPPHPCMPEAHLLSRGGWEARGEA